MTDFSLTVSLREGSKGCFLLIALPLPRAELDFIIHFYLWQVVEVFIYFYFNLSSQFFF